MKEHEFLPGTRILKNGHSHQSIEDELASIHDKLDHEIAAKQRTIERHEQEIQRLNSLLEERNAQLMQSNEKLSECSKNNEGNRQLINKLLNDIERLQQDVEWYKRTYEKRSLLGTIRQKLFINR